MNRIHRIHRASHLIRHLVPGIVLGVVVMLVVACTKKEEAQLPTAPGPSRVEIVEPKAGSQTIYSEMDAKWTLVRGEADKGHHVHLFLDGREVGRITAPFTTIRGVSPGPHRLTAKVATADHILLPIEHSVEFTYIKEAVPGQVQ